MDQKKDVAVMASVHFDQIALQPKSMICLMSMNKHISNLLIVSNHMFTLFQV